MIKWIALLLALVALDKAADSEKVRDEFTRVENRLNTLEDRQCTLMQVLTPSGAKTVCVMN